MFATSNRKTWKQGKNLSATTCSSVATAASSHKSETNWPWSQGLFHTALITQVIQTIPHRPDDTNHIGDIASKLLVTRRQQICWNRQLEGHRQWMIYFFPVLCGQFSKDPDAPWRLRQSRAPSIFPQGQRKVLVLPPHIWATSPKAAPPPTLFNLRSERLSQRLYASSIWKTLFSSSSNVLLLFFEAGSFWAVW